MSTEAGPDRTWSSLEALVDAVSAGRTQAAELVEEALERIDTLDRGPDGLNAFLAVDAEAARAAAAVVDEEAEAGRGGEVGSLAGVPVAVKDNLCTLGLPTTCGSRMLEDYRSPYEATAVRRLRDAGAVLIGKTNMDEFAMGSSTENSAYGPTRNPHDASRVPGGSSGGSAAAVAAGLVPAALGSSTGGSVRQPAAFCGIVGLKPTYGRVSRYGLVAFASSLDQVGTFGRTVADAARLLGAIEGPDRFDSTAAARARHPPAERLDRGLEGLVVGVPEDYFPPELDDAVAARCREAVDRLRAAGAVIRELSLPHTRFAIPAYYVLAPAEASSNLARYDGVRFGSRAPEADSTRDVYEATRERGFGDEVKRRIMLGTYALSAGYHARYYARAQRVRRRIAEDFSRAFAGADPVDVIFTPTSPSTAFELGERVDDPLRMYLADAFTVTANLAGIPGLSLPIGDAGGLPVGGQLLADRWNEATLVRAAAGLERALAGAGP